MKTFPSSRKRRWSRVQYNHWLAEAAKKRFPKPKKGAFFQFEPFGKVMAPLLLNHDAAGQPANMAKKSAHDQSGSVLHAATIVGEVVELNKRQIVIAFALEGKSEEREFYWSDISMPVGTISVGDRVVAKTTLCLQPRMSENYARATLSAIQKKAKAQAQRMPNISALHITVDAQQIAEFP